MSSDNSETVDLRMRRSSTKTLEIDDGAAGNATVNVVGSLTVNGVAVGSGGSTSSRILFLDECNSTTRPTGVVTSGLVGFDSTFGGLKMHNGSTAIDTYTTPTVTIREGLTFEIEFEITGSVADTFYMVPQRTSVSTHNIGYMTVGADGTPKLNNQGDSVQASGSGGSVVVNKRFVWRITFLANGRIVYAQQQRPTGVYDLQAEYAETNVSWANGSTFAMLIQRPANASEVVYLYRVAIYDGSMSASVGQSQ
jgi:hypothetical protein